MRIEITPKLCCKNLGKDDDTRKYRAAIAQAFIDKKYKGIANNNESVLSILKFIYKQSDKISFFLGTMWMNVVEKGIKEPDLLNVKFARLRI